MTASPLTLIRTALLGTAMVALLASPGSVGAERQQRAEHKPGHEFENALCEFGGGTASTHGVINVQIDGHASTQTAVSGSTCSGGMFDGMTCTNYEGGGKSCAARMAGGADTGVIEPIEGGVVDPAIDEPAATDEGGSAGSSVEVVEVGGEVDEPTEPEGDPAAGTSDETAGEQGDDVPADAETPADEESTEPVVDDIVPDAGAGEVADDTGDPMDGTGGATSDPVTDPPTDVVVEPVDVVEAIEVEGAVEAASDDGETEDQVIL